MISELANLSAGRVLHLADSSTDQVAEIPAESLLTSVDVEIGGTANWTQEAKAPLRELGDSPISADEFAALAYCAFGIDDCPALAEHYALSEDLDVSLVDAGVEPPSEWSDTAFIGADASIRSVIDRGLVGSAFAYAKAVRKEVLGHLPTPPVVDALRRRGAPTWLADELTQMALRGAPLVPDEAFARALHCSQGGRVETTRLAAALVKELPSHITHVLIVPWMDSGGAEQVALWHARAVDASGGRCLMIGTDAAKHAWVGRLPASTHYICLTRLLEELTLNSRLSADDCAAALGAALSSVSFQTLHVITSYVGSRMLRLPIDWRCNKVYFSLFGIGCDADGLEAGYWFQASELRNVDRYLTDNQTLPRARARSFALDLERVYSIAYPVEPTLRHTTRRGAVGPRRVLWASRLDREKQPTLVFDIARRMPEVEFHMFGRPVLGDVQLPAPPPNVVLRGGFDGWNSIPAERFDCFLFTSLWEGMPNIILEAMGSGLPVIASRVGAVQEVVDAGRGWLVDDHRDPIAFVSALTEALENPREAARRAHSALLEVTRTRAFSGLMRTLREIGYL